MAARLCSLSWKDHNWALISFLQNLLEGNELADCTLAAEGHRINVHKVVVSACSPYLKMLFSEENDQYPIVILQDVKFHDLKALVDFMYKGEVQVPEERVSSLLEIAQALQIRGLCFGEEMEGTIRIMKVPSWNDGISSLTRISLRRDLLDTSGRNAEQCTLLPLEYSQSNEAGCDSPQLQEAECKPCGPSSLLSVASSSRLFLPESDSINESEDHFEVDRFLDDPEDRKEVKCYVDVEHSVCEEAVFREENLRGIPCEESLTEASFPLNENRAASTQDPVKVSLPREFNSCSVNEHEENSRDDGLFIDSEDRKDVKNLVDIMELSVCEEEHKELGEEKLGSICHSSLIPSMLPVENLPTDSQSVAHLSTPVEELSCSVNEGDEDIAAERSPDNSGDCVDVEGASDTVANSISKEETGECSLEHPWEAQSSSGGVTGHRGEGMPHAVGDRPLNIKTLPRHSQGRSEQECECLVCEKRFTSQSGLDCHMRTHTGEKPFQCPVCGKGFSQKGNLKKHVRSHTGEKPYQCIVCKRNFSMQENLSRHMWTHTAEKLYQCSICGKRFSLNGALTRHMHLHTGEKPYKCSLCKKSFALKENVTRHMRTHTGEKAYQCTDCPRRFSLKEYLRRHMKVHTGVKPH